MITVPVGIGVLVATVAESGVPGFDVKFFYGVAAPAKMQPAVVRRVEEAAMECPAHPVKRRSTIKSAARILRIIEQLDD
jgi:tripartite-type tricarboxylate transporter receptor subunit TctC